MAARAPSATARCSCCRSRRPIASAPASLVRRRSRRIRTRRLPRRQGRGGIGVAAPIAATLVERLRQVHLRMVDAVLAGDGLQRVAELAADAVGGSVAIIVPRLGTAVMAPVGTVA